MKATGIVRRIDDLGRVVIPKEIRRTMRIREGDPLEIFTKSDGEVIFKKYSPMGELTLFSSQLCETIFKTTGIPAVVCDRDIITAAAGSAKRELLEKKVSLTLEKIMESRRSYRVEAGEELCPVTSEGSDFRISAAVPITAGGDVSGCVLFVSKEGENFSYCTETESKIAGTVASFLSKQIEG
ncbi:MAG: AbrB/MazE/SpoVT family DNA-binding domain-containing protein [Clostridia bacterium]|nr:AbrB/MazE/SpoVT family DNA-binding domain-containing protein [Clostridia bacterium]